MSNTRHSTIFLYLQCLHSQQESISSRFYYSAALHKYMGVWFWFIIHLVKLTCTFLSRPGISLCFKILDVFISCSSVPSRSLYLWVIFVAKHNLSPACCHAFNSTGLWDWLFCCRSLATMLCAHPCACCVFRSNAVLHTLLYYKSFRGSVSHPN